MLTTTKYRTSSATITGRHLITDGPFAESKEAVAGFFVVQAATLDEAVEIANGCPGLEYGQTVVGPGNRDTKSF